jgi:hypothetical protein
MEAADIFGNALKDNGRWRWEEDVWLMLTAAEARIIERALNTRPPSPSPDVETMTAIMAIARGDGADEMDADDAFNEIARLARKYLTEKESR